jgi:hypothetical protein
VVSHSTSTQPTEAHPLSENVNPQKYEALWWAIEGFLFFPHVLFFI